MRPSVRLSCRLWAFCGLCIYINFQCGVQRGDAFIPTLGSRRSYIYFCISISLSLYPFLRITFWRSNCVTYNFVQRMRPQATGSNPLSEIIIYPSVRPLVRSSTGLLRFFTCINFQRGGPAPRFIYMSVHPSLCLSVQSITSLFGDNLCGP